MSQNPLARLEESNEPMARRVTVALRQAIVSMHLSPGEMLSEQDLAQRFGVSRSPVREAFIKLSQSGLVRVLPQRGTLVVKISPSRGRRCAVSFARLWNARSCARQR